MMLTDAYKFRGVTVGQVKSVVIQEQQEQQQQQQQQRLQLQREQQQQQQRMQSQSNSSHNSYNSSGNRYGTRIAFSSSVVASTMILVLVASMSRGTMAFTVVSGESNSAKNDLPECVYLEQSQELDCVCPDMKNQTDMNSSSLSPLNFPSSLLPTSSSKNNSALNVASVKLHSCSRRLRLRIDLASLARPFYRLRVEDVHAVQVDGIEGLKSNDSVDIWFRNINGSVVLTGGIQCSDCKKNTPEASHPRLTIQMLDNLDLQLNSVMAPPNVKTRFKIRNANRFQILDSYFSSLPRDSLEVFNVPAVRLEHSEFHNSTESALLLNRVAQLNVSNCLLERSCIEIMALRPEADGGGGAAPEARAEPITEVSWHCTLSPLDDPLKVLSQEEQAECRGLIFREADDSVSFQGAIVLASISVVILLMIIVSLFLLQRSGKLEQYL